MAVSQILLRGATTAEWAASNPVLADREMGVDTDEHRVKIGDGSSAWSQLPWATVDAAGIARLDAAADLLDAASTPTDAVIADQVNTPSSQTALALSAKIVDVAARKATIRHDLREWTNFTVPNDKTGNCTPAFQAIINQLKTWHDASAFGIIHELYVPSGEYAFGSRLSPPAGGGFAIAGESKAGTVFYTPAGSSWLGMNEGTVSDPLFSWADMYFSEFTIDGSTQPDGTGGYVTGLKGLIMHNFRDSVFDNVKIQNTHATGFGCDHLDNVKFLHCDAFNCGRGRAASQPDPTTRFGSGSGFGLGFGHVENSNVVLIDCHAKNNGATGFFYEHLARPESLFRSKGVVMVGCVAEGNAIGFNDAGVAGLQGTGLVARNNLYAGYRVGVSNAAIPGGNDGIVSGLLTYGNMVGVAIEGCGDGYQFNGLQGSGNTRAGVEIRDTVDAFPGRRLKFHGVDLHHNGGPGFLSSTGQPVVGLEITGDVHDNGTDSTQTYRDDITILSPLSRPKINVRTYGSGSGYGMAVRGGTVLEKPTIDLDVTGSAVGGLFLEADVDDMSKVNVYGNPDTVQNLVPRPYPDAGLTGWTGVNGTLSYAASHVGLDGVDLGPHAIITATGAASPRGAATPAVVTARKMYIVSVHTIAPLGKQIQPYAIVGATNLYGPVFRGTGSVQRLDFPVFAPGGVTAISGGVRAIHSTPLFPWVAGDALYFSKVNVTPGSHLWPYIDGSRPRCGWDGAAGASTSTMTIPAPGISYPPSPVLIASDAFTGADVASIAGRALDNTLGGSGTRSWTTPGTTQIGILLEQVYRSGVGAARDMLADFANTSGRFEVKAPAIGPNPFVIRGRYTDDNNHYRAAFSADGSISVRSVKATVSTVVKSAPAGSWVAGDRVAFEVKTIGSVVVLAVYVNGVLVASFTDTTAPITSGTLWGIQVPNDTTARLDDVKFYTVA